MKDPNTTSLPYLTTSECDEQPVFLLKEKPFTAHGWLDRVREVESAYIHIPFCFHKCHYCDFFSIAGADDRHAPFVERLSKELEFVGAKMAKPMRTLFVGGGTPTLLSPDLFDSLFEAIDNYIPRSANCEWTVEANPETVTPEIADVMITHGVNRVSVGAQSFDPSLLKVLERWHEPESVGRALRYLTKAGIANINLDLIYAIPSQTISQVQNDLDNAIALGPQHISCYSLMYEPNTPLLHRLEQGEFTRVDHDVEAAMFDMVRDRLSDAGYVQYEISNFAKAGRKCLHNLMYWKNKNWWPFGPAASGHVDGVRWRNVPRLSEYLQTSRLSGIEDVESLDPDRQAGEAFMMGLRLLEGMERRWVSSLVEQSIDSWRQDVIDLYIKEGLLCWIEDMLALTERGICLADTVVSALLTQDDVITDTTGQ